MKKRNSAGRKKGTTREVLVRCYLREAKAGVDAICKLLILLNGD